MTSTAVQFPATIGDAPAKRAIMSHALRLFVVDGLDSTTIRGIAEEAGFTNPALFRHFESKDALARHLFELCYRRLFYAIDAVPEGSFDSRLAAMIHRYLTAYDETPEAVLYVHDTLRRFWPDMPADIRQKSLIASMRALIQVGKDEGQITQDIDSNLAAGAVIGILAQIARMIYFDEFPGPAADMAPKTLRLVRNMLR